MQIVNSKPQSKYSKHIKNRIKLRRIEYDLPKWIFEQSKERYFDKETGHLIATGTAGWMDDCLEVHEKYPLDKGHEKIGGGGQL